MPNRTADAARVQATLSRLGFDRFHPTPILWSGSMRGCSLMVKPQSSKLITRVRFPSSPRGLGSRRFRVEALFFFPDGNPFRMRICFLARSESARSSSSSPRTIPPTLSGGFFVLGDAGNPSQPPTIQPPYPTKKLHSNRSIGNKYEYLHQSGLHITKHGTLIRNYSILERKIQ